MAIKLTKARVMELDEILAAFPFSLIQDILTFQIHCRRNNIEAAEVYEYLNMHVGEGSRIEKRKRVEAMKAYEDRAPKCEVCGMTMMIEDVNDDPTRMIDSHSKSWWVCPDQMCSGDPLCDIRYPHEVLMALSIPVHNPVDPQVINKSKRRRAAVKQRDCSQGRKKR